MKLIFEGTPDEIAGIISEHIKVYLADNAMEPLLSGSAIGCKLLLSGTIKKICHNQLVIRGDFGDATIYTENLLEMYLEEKFHVGDFVQVRVQTQPVFNSDFISYRLVVNNRKDFVGHVPKESAT